MRVYVLQAITKATLEGLDIAKEGNVEKYVSKCADLCWLIRYHDPPVYIMFEEVKNGAPLDLKLYRSYTKTGKMMDFVVWPPLFLHKDGAILAKGVAEPKKGN